MRLFVVGATGRTGTALVNQALARGHMVTALVRSPERLTAKDPNLTVLKGSVLDEAQLLDGMRNHEAVIATLGPREPFKRGSLLRDSTLAITKAMDRSGLKRLLVLSAAALFPGLPNRVVRFILRNTMSDSLAMERIVQASGLNWTIVRPPRLTNGTSLTYQSREDAAPAGAFSMSRSAVAAFMLDALEQKRHFQKIVGLGI